MANELFPKEEAPAVPEQQAIPLKEKLKLLLRKKTVVIGLVVIAVMSMGTYILVSPASKQTYVAAANPFVPLPPTATPSPQEPTETPITPTPTPTTIPTPTATPTPTIPPGISWKTYANTQYGYRIKYSPDWVFKDLGQLEPKIPSYINFYPKTASASSRFITIGVTTRTYEEQLALGASSSAITVAGIKSTKQYFQDSDGNTSTVVVIPRTNDLVVIRAKTAHLPIFNLMLSTLVLITR